MNLRRSLRTLKIIALEVLDDRIVLSTSGLNPATIVAQEALVAAKGGPALGSVYVDYMNYEKSGGHGTFKANASSQVVVQGTTVALDVQTSPATFQSAAGQLAKLGMKVTSASSGTHIIEGTLPIAKLPAVASLSPNLRFAATTGNSGSLVGANAGPALQAIYQEYETYVKNGSQGNFNPTESGKIAFAGNSVGVDIRVTGSLSAQVAVLEGLGMKVSTTTTAGQVGIIEGYLPISELPTVSQSASVVGLSPMYRPTFYGPRPRFA